MFLVVHEPIADSYVVSNNSRCSCDCLMIDWSVPSRSSLWSGTGTVIVEELVRFCITT